MSWLRSRLFWKIVGIYVLLTMLALTPLLIVLGQKLKHNARKSFEAETVQLLQSISRSAPSVGSLVAPVGPTPGSNLPPDRVVYLCDNNGEILGTIPPASPEQTGFSRTLRRRIVSDTRSGKTSVMWNPAATDILFAAMELPPSAPVAGVLVLQRNAAERMAASAANRESAVSAAVVAWLCGTMSLGFVAILVVDPVRSLLRAMQMKDESIDRRDVLLRLADRNDEFGNVARCLVDIDTDRRTRLQRVEQQEKDMRASARQLSAMMQAMVEGVIAVDSEERILFANNVACSMLDINSEKVTGRPIFEAVRNTVFQEVAREVVESREHTTLEFRLPKKNAQVALTASPISSGGAVLVLADVTEVRRLESMRRDFVSGVSHELKTPLTVIQACTETLLDGAIEDETAGRQFLQQIEEQSERLLQLILGMLQLARLESGEQVFNKEPVDLAEAARQIIAAMSPVADGKHIELSQSGAPELFVLADYQAVRTVVGNLVDNALKYTPDGGHVKIELFSDDSAASLKVVDDGVGIPEKDKARVFERFYRVERDRNRERGGTGLGLAIVKHLCHAMHAEILLDSAAGRGCSITMRFPFT